MAPLIQLAPGKLFEIFLNSVYEQKPLKIIETGCIRDLSISAECRDGWSTLHIARWVSAHPGSEFHTVDLSLNSIELAHSLLEAEGLAQHCAFHLQDSLKFLSQVTWADFCFLDSCDGLQHGLDEFRLAASTGARLIVMDDFQTKAFQAVKEAKNLGWDVSFQDRYSVLRRPK
jgi:predicted O-methyltransferase YrrM